MTCHVAMQKTLPPYYRPAHYGIHMRIPNAYRCMQILPVPTATLWLQLCINISIHSSCHLYLSRPSHYMQLGAVATVLTVLPTH